jgi:hypothetical protein
LENIGVEAFLDVYDIHVGDDFRQIILTQIRACDEVLVLLTPTSIERAWVPAELGIAIDRDKRIVGIRYGVTLEELHERGLVSLIGDAYIIPLDDVEQYVKAVTVRAKGGRNG